MGNVKLSVIVLAYNRESAVLSALRSVADCCEGLDYEIIIGEDSSADSTRARCEEFAAEMPAGRVHLMPAAPNKGLVRNYFDCLEAARGEYIADCSADDCWLPSAPIAAAISRLDADPTLSVVFSDTETFTQASGLATLSSNPFPSVLIPGSRIIDVVLNHVDSLPFVLSAAVYRRRSVDAVMKRRPDIVCNPSFGCEDLPVIAALASEGNALYLPGPWLRYVILSDSVSNDPDPERQVRFYAQTLECTRRLCEYYGREQSSVRAMFRAKAKYLAGMAYRSGNRDLYSLVRNVLKPWALHLPLTARLHLLALRFLSSAK